jgi:RNA polymerase sigma-70 factor, ECF subfamily
MNCLTRDDAAAGRIERSWSQVHSTGGRRSPERGTAPEEGNGPTESVGIEATVARTASADRDAVGARLYETHAGHLLRFCRGQLRSEQEAEDAVQTTFLHAVQALRRGVVPDCESAWLTTIAKNVCSSQRRSAGRRARYASDVEIETIEAPARGDDAVGGIREALQLLPERQRRAFVLREWLGLSSSEVASRMGIGTTEAYAVLTRARRSMAEALAVTTGRTTAAVNIGMLVLKLRSLLFGGAAKTATTGLAVVAVTVGGVAVERTLDRSPSRAPAPHATAPTVSAPAAGGTLLRDVPGRTRTTPATTARRSPARQREAVATRVAPSTPASSNPPLASPLPDGRAGPSAVARDGPVATDPASNPPVDEVGRAQAPVRIPDLVGGIEALLPPLEPPIDEPALPDLTDVTKPVERPLETLPDVSQVTTLPDQTALP